MSKRKSPNRFKLLTGFLGISAIAGVAATVASCAQPNASTVNNLFKTGNNFSNLDSLNNNDIAAQSLIQKDGFNNFLSAAIANVLKVWYENNPDSKIKDKLKTWNDEINKSWDTQAQSYRDQYRQDYLVKLQTDILDDAGGTETSWKNNQLNSKILSDFSNLLYSGDYLRYVDANGDIVTQPDRSTLNNPDNWKNLKYTNKTVDSPLYTDNPSIANNKQMFAEMQGFIFNQWVKEQNPNLLSRVVFTNETPKNGFASVFNDELISSPSASYEFQFFNPADPMSTQLSASSSYQNMVRASNGGLSQFVNDFQIDIPKEYSGDSGGKLLMTADDMFNSYDLSFTAGFVDQYLKMLGYNSLTTWPTGTPDPDSIMKNFIRDTSTDPNVVSTKLDYLTQKDFEKNNLNFFSSQISSDNNFYQGLWPSTTTANAQPTKSIYNVFSPISQSIPTPDDSDPSATTPNDDNQFIFVRGKDGVHIIAIDGGGYYLDSTKHQRDIIKQEQFLMFRSLYRTLNYVRDKQLDYSFSATTQSQNWFQKNEAMLIYEAFADALSDPKSYLNIASNSALKSSFENLYNTVNDYVSAADQYFKISNYSDDVNTIRSKIYDFAKTYIDNDKNKKSASNGIAAKFPNKSAPDGSYPSLEEYYALLVQNPSASSATILDQKLGSRNWFNKQLNSAKTIFSKAALNLVNSLTLTSINVSDYSQNILLKSNTDDSYSLGINLAINSAISSSDISNKIKLAYFQNSDLFKSFYDLSNSSIKSTYPHASDIQAALQNYYNVLQWIALDNKGAYGVPQTVDTPAITDDQKVKNFETILNTVFTNQNISNGSYNDDTLNYYTYLYTFAWLIDNNFAQFKAILNSQIVQGVNGIISWSVPVPVGFDKYSTNDPLSTFPDNPNFIWGSPTNWSNQSNEIKQGDLSNDLANPYLYTKDATDPAAPKYHYGFNGLSLNNDPKINSSLSSTFFSGFNNSKLKDQKYSEGALYPYGSTSADIISYVSQMNTIRELNSFIQYLSSAGFNDVSSSDLQQSNNDVETKKTALIKLIEDLNASDSYVFSQYKGYIGKNKSTTLADLKPTFSSDAKQQLPAYVIQVNFNDVNQIGADSWTNTANSLGLNLYAFLTIIAMQASDSATQSNALSYLINNSDFNGTVGQKVTVGDSRLYNSLTSRWVNS